MRLFTRFSFWIKSAQAMALAVAVCFSLGATDAGSHYTDLNHRLMCTCGCAQLLGECNHVGCPELCRRTERAARGHCRGQSDQEILAALCRQIRRHRSGRSHHAGLRSGGLDCPLCRLRRGVHGHHSAGSALVVSGKTQATTRASDPAIGRIAEQIRRDTGDEGIEAGIQGPVL